MENKNKELALKNIQLKEEIDKLIQIQTTLMKDSIKYEYYTNRLIKKMTETLDENIIALENALERTKKMRSSIKNNIKKNERDVLTDKNK